MENITNDKMVSKVLELTTELNSSKTEIDSLNREIGSKEAHITTLEAQIAELKSKQPEVRIVKGKTRDTWFGTIQEDDVIDYRNLDSVKLDIEKVIEKKYKVDLEKLEKELKSAKESLESKDADLNNVRKQYSSETENSKLAYRLRQEELEREYKDKAAKKDLKIKELQEEITKVKEDKTDEQLEKLRTEEIANLKLQIKKLKGQVDEFIGMNIFKRAWLALTNQAVRVAAEKEIQEKENELRKNRDEQASIKAGRRSNSYNWLDMYTYRVFGF